jgi:hypothetical protein
MANEPALLTDKRPAIDLTSEEGVKKAVELFNKYGWLLLPLPWAAKQILDRIFHAPAEIAAGQKEAAVAIIQAGKEAGVDSLRITVDQRVGVDFGVPIKGIPIKIEAGSNGKMVIEVKYKEKTTTDDTDGTDKQIVPAPRNP